MSAQTYDVTNSIQHLLILPPIKLNMWTDWVYYWSTSEVCQ